jgi:uncharacterized membrane protein YdjX (TVP38/TMEM64 family)
MTSTSRTRLLRLGAVLVVLAMMLGAWQTGVLDRFGSPAELKTTLLELGPRAYLGFIVAYTLLQPFGVPATAFIWGAPLVWEWHIAFALSLLGTMGATVVGFAFARFVARDWVSQRIPERWRRYDDAVERRAFASVFLLRLVFWMPPPLHFFFGVSKVGFWTHFFGSLLGYLAPLALVAYFGDEVVIWLLAQPWYLWAALALVLVGAGLVAAQRHRRRNPR